MMQPPPSQQSSKQSQLQQSQPQPPQQVHQQLQHQQHKPMATEPARQVAGGAAAASQSNSTTQEQADVDVNTIEKMKVSDLRAKLQANGLLTEGKKSDLVQRYVTHLIDVTKSVRGGSSSDSSRNKRKRPLEEPDSSLVHEVRSYMKTNKLSQVMVGQEARVSQAVISQWLSLKYHGHNSKVRAVLLLLLLAFWCRGSAWTRSDLLHAPFRSMRRCGSGLNRAVQVMSTCRNLMSPPQSSGRPVRPRSARNGTRRKSG